MPPSHINFTHVSSVSSFILNLKSRSDCSLSFAVNGISYTVPELLTTNLSRSYMIPSMPPLKVLIDSKIYCWW